MLVKECWGKIMNKIYYRCHKCHSKVKKGRDILVDFNLPLFGGSCAKCNLYTYLYACQHTYWWERLYLTIKDLMRKII